MSIQEIYRIANALAAEGKVMPIDLPMPMRTVKKTA